MDKAEIEAAVKRLLKAIGEDPRREGLKDTPRRVAEMYEEIFGGISADPRKHLKVFSTKNQDEMILVRDVPFYSMCEHHLMPFFGVAHVAYIPRDKVVGLSKIPRIVDMFARRLQVQERLTNEVADALQEALDPVGVIVVFEGAHSCAALRGVKKHGVNMLTTAKRGEFRTNRDLRDEFYRMIGK